MLIEATDPVWPLAIFSDEGDVGDEGEGKNLTLFDLILT